MRRYAVEGLPDEGGASGRWNVTLSMYFPLTPDSSCPEGRNRESGCRSLQGRWDYVELVLRLRIAAPLPMLEDLSELGSASACAFS